ncbi:TnsA endonuclease N-terminal domain-containing protein [Microcoleus asticus]|uniref:Transposon Tn7 transposition protein TnsA n=1 Tax=Microcoleus asticus IPMA8 TaxID=2563858 RepID=A0ABX2D5B6_9CYAN|nr:TnsA endonuclease N-terminal domain-containing protein [Microcoleus asticus]NQE37834.1 Transposon Tn7 transposition protein TnsA [Microcoleus asticus IPMA8]
MAKRSRNTSETTIENRLKQGRGMGQGANYNPWLHIQDVPSQGLASRIKGWKTRRVHHLLSELETSYFYVLDWSLPVLDIREQFPLLPLEETLAIAEQCGVAYPTDPRTKEPVVMTTDFVVTVRQSVGSIEQARTVKYAQDLQSKRNLEKLEIERCYWQRRNIDWGIVTEREVSKTLAENIKWLHPYLDLNDLPQSDITRITMVMTPLVLQAKDSLANIAAICDDQLGLTPGFSLLVVRHLLANRVWQVNMVQPILPSERLVLLSSLEPLEEIGGVG